MRVPCWITGFVAWVCLAYGQQQPAPTKTPAPSQDGQITIATTAEEVVLDLIVRDKKGRPVKDLKPEEIEISDGDQPAKIRSLRFTELEQTAASSDPAASKRIDPMRQVRLVTLLFDSLSIEPAIQAKSAAHEVVKAGAGPNVYFSILRMAGRLQPLQEFTNNGPLLHQAIDKFVGAKADFTSQAQQVENRLRNMAGGDYLTQDRLVGGDTSVLASGTDAFGKPSNPAAIPMAALLLNVIMTATQDAKEVQGRPILGALRAAADQQRDLPGRKTIVYFTEGWNLTYALKEQFNALISAANRANVSFYIVDAGGLVTGARNEAARKMLSQAAAVSSSQGMTGSTSFEQARGVDTALESMNANTQTALMDLAGSTGGTFISDSNDLRKPMQKLVEDVNAYYEVNYSPQDRRMDGHLRSIKVKVNRPGVKIQSRSGYFDLPHGSSNLKGSWEVSALRALEENPSPQGFAYQAKAFPLRRQTGQVTGELVFQIPISALEPEENPSAKTFRLRFGVVVLFRDTNGKVVQKLSREIAHEGAQDAWERAKASNYFVTQSFQVPPGAYSIEMAAVDAVSSKVSVMRMPASFGAGTSGLDMGGPIVVQQLDPVGKSPDRDPLRYENTRVLPSIAAALDGFSINPKKTDGLPLFFLIQPSAIGAAKLELALEIKRNGEAFTTLNVPLPESKTPVEFPYVATIPTAALGGGKFELLAKLRQGDSYVERKIEFLIEGEPRILAKVAITAGKTTSGSPSAEPEEDATLPVVDIVAAPLHANLKPNAEDEARILNGARKRALEYASNLPNFVCMQVTRRFEQPVPKVVKGAPPPVKEEWKEIDSLSEQLTYVDGHENYQKINGAQRGNDMGRGILSAGEFGALLRMVFRAESKAELKWHDLEIENGKKLHVFEYSIPRATSQYLVRPSHTSPAVAVAARGTITVDEETYQIRKIQLAAVDLPKKFPFQESIIEVEYDMFSIGDQFSLLPKRAGVRVTAGRKMNRNAIEYLNYRKWGGTSELKFGDPVPTVVPPPPAAKKPQ